MATLAEIQAELQKRGETTSNQSVFDPAGTSFEEFKKFAESSLKGPAKGIVDIIGGYGTLYDYLKQSKDPNAFSGTGISQAIKNLTGINLQSIEGYSGAYEFGRAGAPAALLSAVGLPGLFSRTPIGIASEYGVAGGTGVAAQTVAPDSPYAQLLLQTTPYAIKGGITQATKAITKPEGLFPPIAETSELSRVGRLTAGELGLNREQLAMEAAIGSTPSSGQKPIAFRQAQASDAESFLTNLFNKASGKTLNPTETTQAVLSSFQNYGKSLTSKLKSDARTDFGAAKSAGGMVDTGKLVSSIDTILQTLPVETPSLAGLRNNLQKIIDEFTISIDPATGQRNVQSISIDRLQKNLSAWGEAAYSGSADFGAGNIFEGVASGQAKGVAKTVLNGYRQALDDAITQGVAGADKLKIARDKFKQNLDTIDEFANRPLTKAFDVERITDLVPEDVLRDLKKMPLSQRQVLIDVMQTHPNSQVVEVLNTIRREKFNDVLNAAQVKGSASTDPTFNIQSALTELDNKSGEFSTLFSSSKDAAEARLAMNWMRRTLAGESAGGVSVGLSGSEVYAATAAGGGGAPTRLALREIVPLLQRLVASPKDFADVIFNPDYRKAMIDLSTPKTTTKKVTNALKTLSQGLGIMAARAGPMLQTERPEMQSDVQPVLPTDDSVRLQEIQDALKALEAQ